MFFEWIAPISASEFDWKMRLQASYFNEMEME